MKWENRDTDVVEQANIPKFSKLDDIGTLSDFESFFDDVLVNIVIGYTKLYGHREKAEVH